MKRRRALGYSVSVTAIVFVGLALPVLREVYGPIAALAGYAMVALVAGFVTWTLLSQMNDSGTEDTTVRVVTSTTSNPMEGVAVEGELETVYEQVESENND